MAATPKKYVLEHNIPRKQLKAAHEAITEVVNLGKKLGIPELLDIVIAGADRTSVDLPWDVFDGRYVATVGGNVSSMHLYLRPLTANGLLRLCVYTGEDGKLRQYRALINSEGEVARVTRIK